MPKKDKTYRRLPGRFFLPFVAKTLWQAEDHLLYMESLFFRERYKRFYYNDIQSIVLQRTGIHRTWSIVWGAFALLFGIIAFLVPGPPYVSGTITVLFLLAFLANLAMGPSCSVYLQTAVQLQKISCLRRLHKADKVMTRIKLLIEEKQGQWQKQKSVVAQNSAAQTDLGTFTGPQGAEYNDEKIEPEPKGPFKKLLHQIMFGLFIVLGILGAVQVFLKSLPIGLVESLLHAAVQIVVIVALVRWFRHLKGTLIAKFNWVALVFIALQTTIGYAIYMLVSIRNPEINYHHWEMFKLVFEFQAGDHPLALAGNIIFAGGSLLLGTFGLLIVQRWKSP